MTSEFLTPIVTSTTLGMAADGAAFLSASVQVRQVASRVAPEITPTAHVSRGDPSLTIPATGFFTTRKVGEAWWFFDPAGNAFFVIGTDHVNYEGHECERLGYAPYHRNCESLYGSEATWAESTVKRLLAWGFNCLASNSSFSVRHRGLAHQENVGLGRGFLEGEDIAQRSTWSGFPNVFIPEFRQYCEEQALQRCAPNADDPWLIGYFIDNELDWHVFRRGGMFVDTVRQPADHAAKLALVNMIRQRHATLESFNAAWRTHLASFEDLPGMTEVPKAATPEAQEDERAWTRLVAEQYFSITTGAIRKHDPNHLILGCRFAGEPPDILDIVGKYCDALSMNCYRRIDLTTGEMTDGFAEVLQRWYSKAGKPLMLTEWSFPALDSGLPCRHGAGQRVPTQKDRAFAFTAFQKLLFTTPFMIGSNYFMWMDEPALGISSRFPEDTNYGLVNEQDTPYELLTAAAARLNPLVYGLHSGQAPDLSVEPAALAGNFLLSNSGRSAGKCMLGLWADGTPAEQMALTLDGGASHEVATPADVLQRPGGHFLACRVEPDDPVLERSPGDNLSVQALYTPGTKWAGTASARIPLLVTNPTAATQEQAIVEMPVKGSALEGPALYDPTRLAAFDAEGMPIPCQVDRLEGGDVVAVQAGALPPWGRRTVFLCPGVAPQSVTPAVKLVDVEDGKQVVNGPLALTMRPGSTCDFDRIEFNGVEMGQFMPLVRQAREANPWLHPCHLEKIELSNGPVRLVLDVTSIRADVAGEAKRETPTSAYGLRDFRVKFRFVIEPGRPWFTSRLIWLENTDTEPLIMEGYFHYLPSNIAGDASDDEPRGYFWTDARAGLNFGMVSAPAMLNVNFWRDETGAAHPDAYRKLVVMVHPGERYAEPETTAYVICAETVEWDETLKQADSSRRLIRHAFPLETKPETAG
jgi:agarase